MSLETAAGHKIFGSPVSRSYFSPVASDVSPRARQGAEAQPKDLAGSKHVAQARQRGAVDDVDRCFRNIDVHGTGMLTVDEVEYILKACQFEVDMAYMQQVADAFGSTDASGANFGIYPDQFREMWHRMSLSDVVPAELLMDPLGD